jgi:hypothetical protein
MNWLASPARIVAERVKGTDKTGTRSKRNPPLAILISFDFSERPVVIGDSTSVDLPRTAP